MELAPLLGPGSVRGFASSPHRAVLPNGLVSLLQNARVDRGTVEARGGDSGLTSIASSGTVRGQLVGLFDGLETLFVALGDGSKVRIYKSASPQFRVSGSVYSVTAASRTISTTGSFADIVDGMWVAISGFANAGNNGAFQVQSHTGTTLVMTAASWVSPVDEAAGASVTVSGWVEITNDGSDSSNDPYGDTRLSDATDRPIWFSIVRERPFDGQPAYDLLVSQNGVDAPRIYGKGSGFSSAFGIGKYGMSVVSQPELPADDSNTVVIPGFLNYLQIGNSFGVTYTPAGTGMAGANSGLSSTDNSGVLTLTTAGWSDGTCTISFPVDANFANSKQLALIANNSYFATDPDWHTKLTVALGDGVNGASIYDPVAGVGDVYAVSAYQGVEASDDGASLLVYELPKGTDVDWTSITEITFGFSEAPAADQTIGIHLIAASGRVP